MKRNILLVTLLGTLCLAAGIAAAQSESANLVLIITPPNPAPNEWVTIEVKTISHDLKRSNIGWLQDGKLVRGGTGETMFSFRAGKLGEASVITVVVETPNGSVYERGVTIQPASVDLIWESGTTVPPFYKGKALYTQFGATRVVAIPEIWNSDENRLIAPANLYYTWRKDDEVLGDRSGYGRSYLLINELILRPPCTIEVLVESADKRFAASGSVSLEPEMPRVLIYEDNPLYGILFNRALTESFNLVGNEVTLEAFPFFFNAGSKRDLSYSWSLNGNLAESFKGSYLTLRNTNQGPGSAAIQLRVSNPRSFTEGADGGFTISFGNQ